MTGAKHCGPTNRSRCGNPPAKTLKLYNDPKFEEKLVDVVGLYVNPTEKAIVLCADEKYEAQALDGTEASLPMVKGRGETMTDDYKRHGTTTLFAALDVLTGMIISQCMPRHRHQEWLKFLRPTTAGRNDLQIHLILDNYTTHKHEDVRKWLDKHPRSTFTSPRHRRRGEPRRTLVPGTDRQSVAEGTRCERRQHHRALAAWWGKLEEADRPLLEPKILSRYDPAGQSRRPARPLTWGPFWDHTSCAVMTVCAFMNVLHALPSSGECNSS